MASGVTFKKWKVSADEDGNEFIYPEFEGTAPGPQTDQFVVTHSKWEPFDLLILILYVPPPPPCAPLARWWHAPPAPIVPPYPSTHLHHVLFLTSCQ